MIIKDVKDQRWFAWHPVRLDGETGVWYQAWVWLQLVHRSRPSYKYPWSYKL